MNVWPEIHAEYAAWLRTFPMVARIGIPCDVAEVVGPPDEPVFLDAAFWSERTHAAEAVARRHLSETEIDYIIDDVAAVIDENLRRFDPLVAYYGRFAPDGDPSRIEWERDAAHSVKRDLAWAASGRSASLGSSVRCCRGTISDGGRSGGLVHTRPGMCGWSERCSQDAKSSAVPGGDEHS